MPKKKPEAEESIESSEYLDDSVVAEENAAETIKKLREKLKSVEKENLEIENQSALELRGIAKPMWLNLIWPFGQDSFDLYSI